MGRRNCFEALCLAARNDPICLLERPLKLNATPFESLAEELVLLDFFGDIKFSFVNCVKGGRVNLLAG